MLIERNIFQKIVPWLSENKILIIKGARQTGKTTLLRQIQKYLEQNGEKTVYFSVDQELGNPVFEDYRLFLKKISEEHRTEKNGKIFIFLDEFQFIRQAGLFLKNIFDIVGNSLQLIVSGSSSLEITKNSEFLTGRKIDFFLHHFSWIEYLKAQRFSSSDKVFSIMDEKNISDFYAIYKKELEMHFVNFMNYGGYPEIVLTENIEKRKILLKEIIRNYIEKDVAFFLRIENITGFNHLIKILAAQIGNLLNREETGNTLGMNKETVKKYLEILEGTFIFSFLRPYFTNIRKELSKMPKIFISDPGIWKITTESPDSSEYAFIPGSLVENFVFNELSKNNEDEIYFYRTAGKAEIDFILKRETRLYPIEVKFRKNADSIPVAMKNFAKNYPKNVQKNIIITRECFDIKKDAVFLPVTMFPLIDFL